MKLILGALLALSCASCAVRSAEPPAPKPQTRKVTQILLSKTTNGFGGGKAGSISFTSRGVARRDRHGRMVKNKNGSYSPEVLESSTGTISGGRFKALARALDREGFWSMKPFYNATMTDQARTTISALDSGKRVTVTVDGNGGPEEFTRLVQALREEEGRVEWKAAGKKR